MPKLIIDQREVEVPTGEKVIDAAARLGIMIPRFCYHPALGSLGACRMCAVKFVEGPVKGIDMSCMVEARDGMVVSTDDPEAVEFRRYVIEWLMLHHPHDCPVCDEGGHCLLQDETVSGGHGLRRYLGKKRTFRDQYLGVFVQHEMNRCIHCWRCRRFYQEFAGYRDLGALAIANRTYFGRLADGALESPFSGNLIDICPTGVYTDRPARFKWRRWDLERAPSVCLHCSLGCNTIASARYREVARQEARFNERVNGYFICDRGRFGFYYANHPERPRTPRVNRQEVSWSEALEFAAEKLAAIRESAGPGAIACLGSPRSSLESLGGLKRFGQALGAPDPIFFLDPARERKVGTALARLDRSLSVSLREIEDADFILMLGADPTNEAPMLALALRQAQRRGAAVAALDPRPLFLPLDFDHLPVAPWDLNLCLNAFIKGAFGPKATAALGPEARKFYDSLAPEFPGGTEFKERLAVLGQVLARCQKPVIICGADLPRETTLALAADHASLLKALGKQAGLFYLLPGPNAFAAGVLGGGLRGGLGERLQSLPSIFPPNPLYGVGGEGAGADGPGPPLPDISPLIQAIEAGGVKALVAAEADPFWDFPDRERLTQALGGLDLLVVMDYLPSPAMALADAAFPTLTVFEREGAHFVNQEGRLQKTWPAHAGGRPILQVSGGSHPPRVFEPDIPGGKVRSPGEILGEIAGLMSLPEMAFSGPELWDWLAREHPVFAGIFAAAAPPEGISLLPEAAPEAPFSRDPGQFRENPPEEGFLELHLVDSTFGTEELSGYSEWVQKVEGAPRLVMEAGDGARLGLCTGDEVLLHLDDGPLEVGVCLAENMAPGVLILPRHRQLAWQKLKRVPKRLAFDRVEKV